MPALVAGIHVFGFLKQHVDGRDEPGHDARTYLSQSNDLYPTSGFLRYAIGTRLIPAFRRREILEDFLNQARKGAVVFGRTPLQSLLELGIGSDADYGILGVLGHVSHCR